jgi:hypothetical protein
LPGRTCRKAWPACASGVRPVDDLAGAATPAAGARRRRSRPA